MIFMDLTLVGSVKVGSIPTRLLRIGVKGAGSRGPVICSSGSLKITHGETNGTAGPVVTSIAESMLKGFIEEVEE